ncbi:uncharacterized protein A1O9_08735 [Exophiala aquamarina CBS 119918]|uniref:Xylanolytic transcriptional activator regulatory domain-containing protein n=1 Tax=Exophiala aquamarina CBS 119918 TaxID=1182545 RepID=A0A072P5T3_9EURO|nr:uncharacterized protein A1O9_08735 [Exophiala aquamarina CBS 119918]KEF55082.1 hypothetical protein A1O9_08735 [Exophiala aquamarina CBS 119918]
MSEQLRTVMAKVDNLNERLSSVSPPGQYQQAQQSVAGVNVLQERAIQQCSPGNALQLTSPRPREQSMQPSAMHEPETMVPEYHGPTSSEFTFEVANESLTELRVGCTASNSNQPVECFPIPRIPQNPTADKTLVRRLLGRNPLWTVARSDALRYLELYYNTVGAMYPVTDGPRLASKLQLLFDSLDIAKAQRYNDGVGSLVEMMFSVDTEIIKIQVAIGMITELGVAGTDIARELVQSVIDSSDDSLMNLEGLHGVQVLVSIALFYYNLDEELRASRYSCLASRRCLEMGLHRRDTIVKHYPVEEARKAALRIFWSVFTLDRRSSLGLGVPFVIQDTLVDPALASLEFDHLYLRSMITFAKISGRAWQMSNEFSSKEPDVVREEIDYLDYQVLQWQKQIPTSLRYCYGSSEIPQMTSGEVDGLRRLYLSVALFVRANQLRNVIYRPLLQSASRIKNDPEHSLAALHIAKESIKAFVDLDATTNLLQIHATFFKHFIVSSLGNLLLIVVHATTEYWTEIQDTFHAASTLLRKLSTRSGPILRAWDRLKGLEDLQAKILNTGRRKAETQQQNLNDFAGMGVRPSEESASLDNNCELGDLEIGESFMLFDSQICDEFAGLFDPSYNLADFYEFP